MKPAKETINELKALGLTQYRISKLTGISQSAVSLLARGLRTRCEYDTARKLHELLVAESEA